MERTPADRWESDPRLEHVMVQVTGRGLCVLSLFSHHRHRCRHLIHHSHSWYYYDNYNVNCETSVTVISLRGRM